MCEKITVVLEDRESRPIGPFVLEQPNAQNDHTTRIYLFDKPPSNGWFHFDLHILAGSPEKYGLK